MDLDIVVIDDDAVVLFLHKVLIQKSPLRSNLKEFPDAVKALDHVTHRSKNQKLLIFLDINMPGISGWEFLKALEGLPTCENTFVVMVTSSINKSDKERAKTYSRVIDYREKPLTKQACEEIYIKILPLINS